MEDKFVVDASVALKWQFKDELETEGALHMLTDFVNGEIDLISPSLFSYEIVNAVHIAVSRERIPEKAGTGAINDILSLGVRLVDFGDLVERTFKLAQTHNRSAYDCSYLALAEKEACFLYTADKRFFNAMNGRNEHIKWIGNFCSHSGRHSRASGNPVFCQCEKSDALDSR